MKHMCVLSTGGLKLENLVDEWFSSLVDLKRCAAYEVTSLSRKKVVMKNNPAYECVTVGLQ